MGNKKNTYYKNSALFTEIFFVSKISSPNDISDEESASTFSPKEDNNNSLQKITSRPFNPVWKHFTQLKSKRDILKYVENQELSSKRQEQLENGMCLAFVCMGISFNVAKNEIFHVWLQDLRPGFKIPSSKTLAERIFNKQIIQIYRKKRIRLAFEKVEALAKIHQYYTTYVKEEISYINHELTLEDMLAIANEIRELDDNNLDEGSGKDNNDNESEFKLLDEILDLEEIFDLNHEIFKENIQNNNIRLDSEHVAEEEPNYNYNIDNLVNKVFV
ncbi:499_t:CDS:2 [Cetraspora pellucida]|uniref:499_t:CDS:1 n=1 Tax=Cetraspora pellucida TaxID=1433469 RepID=A0A9N9G2N1_9GLOM|nr:499_t:CDS:2 [Cetraspora pellucida]